MGDCLGVCGDDVVVFVREIDIARAEWFEDLLDYLQRVVRRTVLDQYLTGAMRIYITL